MIMTSGKQVTKVATGSPMPRGTSELRRNDPRTVGRRQRTNVANDFGGAVKIERNYYCELRISGFPKTDNISSDKSFNRAKIAIIRSDVYTDNVNIDNILRNIRNMTPERQKQFVQDSYISSKYPELLTSAAPEVSLVGNEFAAAAKPGLPEVAPKLWKDRPPGRQTNPVQWILDNYGNRTGDRETWKTQGLTRADIKRLDPQLYQAFAQWVRPGRGHEADAEILPARPHIRAERLEVEEFPIRTQVRSVLPPNELASLRAYEAKKKRESRSRMTNVR